VGHVAHTGMRNMYRIIETELEDKIPGDVGLDKIKI
jgi:hypothetical protein